MSLAIPFAICLVFIGCCTNVIFLELIIREDSGSGNIITFFQFALVAVEGFLFSTSCLRVQTHIPVKEHMMMVGFYFTVSLVNNYALNFNIPMPLHMIFRAGSLMANMMLGIYLLKKVYPVSKYVAVAMITVGISMATMASANQMENVINTKDSTATSYVMESTRLTVGVLMLVFAMFVSAWMGVCQEVLYKKYGKHPREAMFYTHALPLPGFLLLTSDIWSKMLVFSASEPIDLGIGSVPLVPKLWAYLVGNCLTQYVCIRGVFILTTECPSLVVTLIVTLRKFVSLLFSIFYFQNPFTTSHWAATALVFSGTALFTGILDPLLNLVGGASKRALIASQAKTKDE